MATPLPAPATAAKRIPIVTTAPEMDPIVLAETYVHRWPAQENAIRDFVIPLGVDTNHGYHKTVVVNSEVAKRRAAMEPRLTNVRRWAVGAREREHKAGARYHRRWQQTKDYGAELYRGLNERMCALEAQGVPSYELTRRTRADKAAIDAELEERWRRGAAAYDTSAREAAKHRRYCREQRELLRKLEELAASERTMYELDNAKDQVLSGCKAALANLAMWVRAQYFPAAYAHATWARLAPFFRLPGRIVWAADTVSVELRPCNDRPLTRDRRLVCERVRAVAPHLPDGRRLIFSLAGAACPVLDEYQEAVA